MATQSESKNLPDAQELMRQSDVGARSPGGATSALIFAVAVAWSLFQLWIASPLPFMLGVGILNDTMSRSVHLAFALFLAYLAFPAMLAKAEGGRKLPLAAGFYLLCALGAFAVAAMIWTSGEGRPPIIFVIIGLYLILTAWMALRPSPVDRVPLGDWILAAVAAFCAGYLFLFYRELVQRPGNPNTFDLVVAGCGLVALLEATRRSLGPPLMIIALVFLIYTFAGPYMPDLIAHRGASFGRAMTQQWLSAEGVFGIALGVSTSFVFLFVLFGSLLDRAGAGNYFIQVAFALLGHLRGGPAKAAVVASGMTGLISGSSIANVVTTGTFTIPLMKRVGLPGYKAGAVEVAASVNGQIMPPVMGAAAFLMVEYVGIPYLEVIRHAFLPAVISYIALLYIVHLEALKADMRGLPRRNPSRLLTSLVNFGITVASLIILSGAVYWGVGWTREVFGPSANIIVAVLLLAAYLGLLWYSAQVPELKMDDPDEPVYELPEAAPTIKAGLHFLLPVVVLIWALIVERLSPGLSAFWAVAFLIFILLTQRPILAFFRGRGGYGAAALQGGRDLIEGLASGARNMIGIGIATAAAGIIVGTVAMTGLGLVMTQLVEFLSGGNLVLMLILTAAISLILGLGLPTTANYIIVATLMAPVIVELGASSGLIVPLIAVHLFVFYFGIMADVTPPVGLASFAAAAVSRADPIRTGITAFFYSLRTVALPFIFIFNTQLLLIGVETTFGLLLTIVSATIAMLAFAAGTQGYFVVRSRLWESAALLLVAFTLFRPGYWMNFIYPEYETLPPAAIGEVAEATPSGGFLMFQVSGIDIDGREVDKVVMLRLEEAGGDARERLNQAGIDITTLGEEVQIAQIRFGSPAERQGLDFGFAIESVFVPAERPAPELLYIPALLLLGGVYLLQRRRLGEVPRDRVEEGNAPAMGE